MSALKDFLRQRAIRNNPEYASQNTAKEYRKILQTVNGTADPMFDHRYQFDRDQEDRAARGEQAQTYSPLEMAPLDKWRYQANQMILSGNPTLQKQGLSSMAAYRQKQNAVRANTDPNSYREWVLAKQHSGYEGNYEDWKMLGRSGGSKGHPSGLSYEQYSALPDTGPNSKATADRFGRFNIPSKMQEYTLLAGASTKEEEALTRERLGMKKGDWKDMGDHYYNTFTGEKLAKNISEVKAAEQLGASRGKFIADFDRTMRTKDHMYRSLDHTLAELNELTELVGYDTAGFGSFIGLLPATKAHEMAGKIETILARIGLDKMAEMKGQSQTGATGMGQLSEKELAVLQTHLGNLKATNSPRVMKSIIVQIYDQLRETQNAIHEEQRQGAKRYDASWEGSGAIYRSETDRYYGEEYEEDYMSPILLPEDSSDEWEDV